MPAHARHRLAALIASAASLPLLAAPTRAVAASPPVTAQATAADAVFLAYAPPPLGGAGVLCLADTGVNANADTTPGLISATALDGSASGDVDPLGHGTVDAAIAGGSGKGGLIGAWPQLKIVAVRMTTTPSPGQEPQFQFDDYSRGIRLCSLPRTGSPVYAIDLPLSSVLPPSPDQTAQFVNSFGAAHLRGISVVAAAGNDPGPIQLPASEPGVFAVGAGQVASNVIDPNPAGICSFSATVSLTFYAPGCGINTIDPRTDTPKCCGNGTSQASAFTAAVLVALRSYDPALTADKAAQLLLSTTMNGHLDVAAAFRADNLGAIVDAGNAATPKPAPPPPAPAPTPPLVPAPAAAATPVAVPVVPVPDLKSATWRRRLLRITLNRIPTGARLHVEVTFAHRPPLYLVAASTTLHRHIPRPQTAMLRLSQGSLSSGTVSVKL